MPSIQIKFVDQPILYLTIDATDVGNRYVDLIKLNYQQSFPIYRDTVKYTKDYLKQLTKQAAIVFGWNWDQYDNFDTGIAPLLHKSIEELLANGFDKIPAEHDWLIHEIHYCLHLNQHRKSTPTRNSWFQIEWYNDSGFTLDSNFAFHKQLKFGDVKLQNPHVGHGPLQLYHERDGINISQTCKFHNFVKPGINIAQRDYPEFRETAQLISFFEMHDPEFVRLHGAETILHYTGYPVIGRVVNLDDLRVVVDSAELELEGIYFE